MSEPFLNAVRQLLVDPPESVRFLVDGQWIGLSKPRAISGYIVGGQAHENAHLYNQKSVEVRIDMTAVTAWTVPTQSPPPS